MQSRSIRRLLSFREALPAAIALGLLIGLFCVAFYLAWHAVDTFVWSRLTDPLHRIWFSTTAGLVIGLIITWLGDPGTMANILGHFHRNGQLPMRDNVPIIPISLVGLVAGSSAGPEGVLTQVGGSAGSWLSRITKKAHLSRLLTQAGMGAGFGAFLGAPIGGALLWLEMPHRKGLEYYEALIPTLVASMTGYLVMASILKVNLFPAWHVEAFTHYESIDWLSASLVAVLAVGAVWLYAHLFRRVGHVFETVRVPVWMKTTVAGCIIGILGAYVPLSYFYGTIQIVDLLSHPYSVGVLLALLFAKMLAASVTIRGHWQGGLIIPHMLMGAVIGKLFAMVVPGVHPAVCILAGMAAFNAAATHTPLGSALIVLALTGFGGAITVFLASLIAFLLGQRIELIGNKAHRVDLPSILETHREPG